MYPFLLVLHMIICLSLVSVVLVQSGKGGGLAGGAFGGSAQTVFGGRGATDFFTKATMGLGAAFFITSMTLALMSSGTTGSRSLIQNEARHSGATAPAQPGGAIPQGGLQPPTAGTPAPATTGAPVPAKSGTPAPATGTKPPPPTPSTGGKK